MQSHYGKVSKGPSKAFLFCQRLHRVPLQKQVTSSVFSPSLLDVLSFPQNLLTCSLPTKRELVSSADPKGRYIEEVIFGGLGCGK